MPYLFIAVSLGVWALIALHDRPLQEYVRIFFACAVATKLAEGAMLSLRIYEWRMWLLPGRGPDRGATSLIVGIVDPLMAVLFVRYCRRLPVVKAAVVSAVLGAVEWWMVTEGYLIYLRFWHPLLTASIFFTYFLLVWRVATGAIRIPPWADTHGVALWAGLRSDILLGAIAGLWEYQANWSGDAWNDGRMLAVLFHVLIYCPLATIVAVTPLRNRWAWASGATIALFVAEGAAWSYGILVYHEWGVGWSLIRWAAVVGVTVLYAAWMSGRPPGNREEVYL